MLPRISITKSVSGLMVCILLCLTFTSNGLATENEMMERELHEKLQQSVESDVYVQSDDFDPFWDPCDPLNSDLISLEPGKKYNLKGSEVFLYFCNEKTNRTSIDMVEYGMGKRGNVTRNWSPTNDNSTYFAEAIIKVKGPNPLLIAHFFASIEETEEEPFTEVVIEQGESHVFYNLLRAFPGYDNYFPMSIEGEPGSRFDITSYNYLGEQIGFLDHRAGDEWFIEIDIGIPMYTGVINGGSKVVTHVTSSPILVYGARRYFYAEESNFPIQTEMYVFPQKKAELKNSSGRNITVHLILETGQSFDYKIYNPDGALNREVKNSFIDWISIPSEGKLVVFNTRSSEPLKILSYPSLLREQSYRTLDFYVQKGFIDPVKIEDYDAIQFLDGPNEHNIYINLPAYIPDMEENVDYIIFNDSIWYSVDKLQADGVNFTIEDEYVQMNVTDEGLIGRIDNPGSVITTYSTCAPSCDYSIYLFSGVNTVATIWNEAIPIVGNHFSTGERKVAIHQYHPFGLVDGLEGRKRAQFVGLQLREVQSLRHTERSRLNDINFIKENISGGKVVLVGHSGGGVAAYRAAVHLESEEEIQIGNVVAVGSPKWYLPLSDINTKFIYIESLYDRLTIGEWGVVRAPAHSLIIELDPETRDTFFGDHAYYFSNYPWTDSEGNARNNVIDTIGLIYEYTH